MNDKGAVAQRQDLKFLLVSDEILSKHDNDKHVISVPRLAQLYGLPCAVFISRASPANSPEVRGLVYVPPSPRPKYPLDVTPKQEKQIWVAYDNALHVHFGTRQADIERYERAGFIALFPRYDGDYREYLEKAIEAHDRRESNNE